jgi:hypothetical protein
LNKPIILFTNFWDANKLIDRKYFIFSKDDKAYKVNLIDAPLNYNVLSIALTHPPIKSLPNINSRFNLDRLDFFCPTYNILMDYKNGGEWDDYVKAYKILLKKRKSQIVQWIKSLTPDKVYILCCWENTSKGANCHRDILYNVFTASESMRNRAIYISRDGTWDKDADDVVNSVFLGNENVGMQGDIIGTVESAISYF